MATPGAGYEPQGRQSYRDTLRTLSEASVEVHFDPFVDIDWDSPELAVDPHDERWILPSTDALGAHEWYRSLPKERQIEIGRYRLAQICKVGLQFEQVLIAGVMNYLVKIPNQNAEFRYATHEVTEETHHTQMFQEAVNRICPEVAGSAPLFRRLIPIIATVGSWAPVGFFAGILAGEEPIDHLQKSILRAGGTHPLMDRVMQIHIAEEARHIGFAHQFLGHHVPRLGSVQRGLLAVAFPVVLRLLCDVIMVPCRQARADMGIPDEVAREIWWDSPESTKMLRDLFADVRLLCDELGLRGPVVRRLWRRLGIDGRSARFRAEPSSAAA